MYEDFDTDAFIRAIEDVAKRQSGARVETIEFEIGCYAPVTIGGFCEEFARVSRGTAADGARISAVQGRDNGVPWAGDVMLHSVTLSVQLAHPPALKTQGVL